jgi:citrate synthase
MDHDETIRTAIWQEEPESGNPFVTRTAVCHGYDVFGDMVGKARWSEMLFLLFRGEAPTPPQAAMLDTLAVALANAGPRDPAVHAAMASGVVGSPSAAALMAALAVGAGQFNGAREILLMMTGWAQCGGDLDAWRDYVTAPADAGSIWPAAEHVAGFDPNAAHTALPVLQTLGILSRFGVGGEGAALAWLTHHREAFESIGGHPLAMSGLAAAALHDLGFTPEQGEMLYLLLRLPGAAAHALEQRANSYRDFPFYKMDLRNAPAKEKA